MSNQAITAGILTVSDRGARGETEDISGPALCRMLETKLGARILVTACVPDEPDDIAATLTRWAHDSPRPDLLLTTGGTGLAPRDQTPEATRRVIERPHPALLELARMRCYTITPRTYLSRGEAGTIGSTLVINLPGSPRGATEMLEAMLDILPHAIETLRGEVQDDGRANAAAKTGKVIEHEDAG